MTEKSHKKVNVKIIDFEPKYSRYFRDLNYEWLKKYFAIEPYDRIVLENPVNHIIKMGGAIFFALVDNEVAGTCALMKHTSKKYELAKMGVLDKFQNMGIGRRLIEAAIEKAKLLEADKLILGTSKCLEAANHLYQKMGFDYCDLNEIGPLPYIRETVVMKIDL